MYLQVNNNNEMDYYSIWKAFIILASLLILKLSWNILTINLLLHFSFLDILLPIYCNMVERFSYVVLGLYGQLGTLD